MIGQYLDSNQYVHTYVTATPDKAKSFIHGRILIYQNACQVACLKVDP